MYTVRIPIITNKYDERYFDKCFFLACTMRNKLVTHAQKKLNQLNGIPEYRTARMEYHGKGYAGLTDPQLKDLTAEKKKDRTRLKNIMNGYIHDCQMSKSAFEKWIKVQRDKCPAYISSHQAQAIADNVWKGVEKVLFSNGEQIHYRRINEYSSVPQKDLSGVRLKDWNHIIYQKNIYKLKTPDTAYMQAVIAQNPVVRLCSLTRIEFASGWRYYVIITLDGNSPSMHKKNTETERMGVDPGTSMFAAVSNNCVILENLAPHAKDYAGKIRHLQKQIDRCVRLANPNNFNADGTIKKGKHKWVISKHVKRMRRKTRVLYRQQTDYVHTSHRTQINRILAQCSELVIEPLNVKGLQKRKKGAAERSDKESVITKHDGTKQAVHKFKRKKRFGHSIGLHSPGFWMAELKRKAELRGIPVLEVNTRKFRASQLHHDTGEYIKAVLDERYKTISGVQVQRDLYSAFLLSHAADAEHPDFNACIKDFQQFAVHQNQRLAYMKSAGITNKACWGF